MLFTTKYANSTATKTAKQRGYANELVNNGAGDGNEMVNDGGAIEFAKDDGGGANDKFANDGGGGANVEFIKMLMMR